MQWRNLILRVGVAFAFIYPPLSAFFNPDNWVDFFPQFLINTVPAYTLLMVWGIVEIIIGIWILSGKRIFTPSVIALILLLLIVVNNLPLFDILFRDLAIACAAGALALEAWNEQYT